MGGRRQQRGFEKHGGGRTYIAGDEVEMSAIELERACEVGRAKSKVAELVHGRRTLGKALLLVDGPILLGWLL